MASKKSVKKVEITDENVLDLKAREKQNPGFTIHRIQDAEAGRIDVPIERFARNENFSNSHSESSEMNYSQPVHAQASTAVATSDEMMDRPARSVKYDPEELQQRMETFAEKLEKAVIKVSAEDNSAGASPAPDPKELIKVKFDKFVTLVASRDFISVMEKNRNEDIILSSNLLTDLAGAVEEKTEKKTPVIFLVGLAIGVIVTYLLINH